MERKTVNLLWSGGWDGTFRFLQLCGSHKLSEFQDSPDIRAGFDS